MIESREKVLVLKIKKNKKKIHFLTKTVGFRVISHNQFMFSKRNIKRLKDRYWGLSSIHEAKICGKASSFFWGNF